MKKQYKLLALDMDGTLLNSNTEISSANERWIRRAVEEGIHVCFATGRGCPTATPFAEQLGLDGPMVFVNGSEVWESRNKLLSRHPMDSEQVAQLRDLALRYGVWYWGYSLERVYNREEWAADTHSQTWLKFGYFTEDDAAREAILERIPEIGKFEVTNSHPHNIELNPQGISKASGLEQVCKLLGIGMDEIVACGDSLNDLAMIQAAGLGVAMGNAQESVKRAADAVAPSNDEDGIAYVIRKYMLGEL